MKLTDYIAGSRRGREAQQFERRAMDDPMLGDALEGYDAVAGDHLARIERMRRAVSTRSRRRRTLARRAVAVAAAVVLCCGFWGTFYWIGHHADRVLTARVDRNRNVQTQDAHSVVSRVPRDSVASVELARNEASAATPETAELATTADLAPRLPSSPRPSQSTLRVSIADVRGADSVGSTDHQLQSVKVQNAPMMHGQHVGSVVSTDAFEADRLPDIAVQSAESLAKAVPQTENSVQSSETVVVGYGRQKRMATVGSIALMSAPAQKELPDVSFTPLKTARPIDGENSYLRYLRAERIAVADTSLCGTVVLAFDVDSVGHPVRIRVSRSGGTMADSVAVRWLRNGPLWQPARSSGRCKIGF